MIDIAAMTRTTTRNMIESFATAYGKNGLPFFFKTSYSRRYCSFSAGFTSRLRCPTT